MQKIAVVGSGSWGTAIARLLGLKGNEVRLWCHSAGTAEYINKQHRNPKYLPEVELLNVVATDDYKICCEGADSIVVVAPSSAMRDTANAIKPYAGSDTPVIVLSKGIEDKTGMTMAEVLIDVLGGAERVAVLSGPNHAEEVSREKPAATTVACCCEKTAAYFQKLFSTDYFRVYTTLDVVGVEICAAAKNIIAIANGMVSELSLGDNASASLITRGLAEIARLTVACGGNMQTCMGLAGMGDLIATCTSPHSRNRTLGQMLAQGKTLTEYEQAIGQIAEGAVACRTVVDLARRRGVEMPLAETVRKILWENINVENGISELLARPSRPEFLS